MQFFLLCSTELIIFGTVNATTCEIKITRYESMNIFSNTQFRNFLKLYACVQISIAIQFHHLILTRDNNFAIFTKLL